MAIFLQVAALAEEMAATASRLKKRAAIATAIAAVHSADPASDDDALFTLYLAGTPFAESDSRKLNAGGALLTKAVLAVSEATDAALTAAYRRLLCRLDHWRTPLTDRASAKSAEFTLT